MVRRIFISAEIIRSLMRRRLSVMPIALSRSTV
jgi:hypothetical protein